MKRLYHCIIIFFLCTAHVYAVEDAYRFDSVEKERIFNELITELRCPQCQNNNIADSNAGISDDMRAKVYELVQQENYDKEQVIEFMKKRYGDFITYRPPVTAGTITLWVLPAVVIGIGFVFLFMRSRKKDSEQADEDVLLETQTPDEPQTFSQQTSPKGLWAGALVFLFSISVGLYAYTGSWSAVAEMGKAEKSLTELKDKYIKAERVNMQEMQTLMLGLRSDLFKHPDNPENWMILGDIYLTVNDSASAKIAIGNAYKYAPQNNQVRSLYGQMLLQTSDPTEYQKGLEMLIQVVKENNKDVDAISALAFDAYNRGKFKEAIEMWEYLISILPPDSSKAKMYQKTIAHAKSMLKDEQSNTSTPTQN